MVRYMLVRSFTCDNSQNGKHSKQHYQPLLLYEPYANESSQICPFLALRPQFESVHHQNRRISSHSYSHESVIFFSIFGINIF